MVRIFLSQECKNNNHKLCSGGHPAPKGVYGDSLCRCDCHKTIKLESNKTSYTIKNQMNP